jgi:Uma2 family endonuclease
VKKRLYATCNVHEYWIVNLVERHIEVYTEPSNGAYGKTQRYDREQTLRPTHFADLEVPVASILK